MGINSVLREKGEVEAAHNRLKAGGLPVPDDMTKCWDQSKALDFIAGHGDKDDSVLDVGTFKCRILELLYEKGYKKLYGCDLAPVEWRRRIYPYLFTFRLGDLVMSIFGRPPIRLSKQNLEHTRYRSGSFDFITSLSVIEHGVNLENYFREMNRLLKSGGYLINSADYWPDKVDTGNTDLYGLKWNIFDHREIEDMIRIAGKFGFALTEPVDFSYKDPVIELKDRRYSFIFFIFQKKGDAVREWTDEIPRIKERAKATRTLHLCCGRNKYEGAVGIDKNSASNADICWDLDKLPYPFKDNEFDTVICINAIEHLRDMISVINELHRICKGGAQIFIVTPHFSDAGSYIDPTHVHHLSARSLDYFIEGTRLSEEYGFYSQCRFKMLERRLSLHRSFAFMEKFANKHIAFYEEVLCYIVRGKGVYFELEVVK